MKAAKRRAPSNPSLLLPSLIAKPSTCACAASNGLAPCIDAVMIREIASVAEVLQWLITTTLCTDAVVSQRLLLRCAAVAHNNHTQILWLELSSLCSFNCCLCPWLIERAATIAGDPTGSCSSNRRRRRTRRCSTRIRNSRNCKRNSCSIRSNNRQALTARPLRSRCRVYSQGECGRAQI